MTIRIFFFCLLLPIITQAANDANKLKSLQHINNQITHIKSKIHQEQHHRTDLHHQLKKIELEVATLSKQQRAYKHKILRKKIKLSQLITKQTKLQIKLAQQKQHLLEQFRVAYRLERQSNLKILLNQKNPQKLQRNLVYLNYLNRARVRMITDLSNSLAAVKKQHDQITAKEKILLQVQHTKKHKQQLLQHKQKQRKRILLGINRRIKTRSQHLAELQADRRALEKILHNLKSAKYYGLATNIAKLRGKLPLPVTGKINYHYLGKLTGKSLWLNGLLINAPKGREVHAIYPGKIVFANWIRGFGLLLIIDHGQGFMSLYGHNNNLYKTKGDRVAAGELIATVGQSGGLSKPGLYFELRHNGKPLDPRKWCRLA